MIHWTTSGAVATPTTVQVRLSTLSHRSLKVGLKVPERQLTVEEFENNLQYFQRGLDTPRSIPCTSLTLSGLPVESTRYFEALQHCSNFQFTTLHLGSTASWDCLRPYQSLFDRLVLSAGPSTKDFDVDAIPPWAMDKVQFIVSLTGDPLTLEQWLESFLPWAFKHHIPVTFSHPFPLSEVKPLSPSSIVGLFQWLSPLLDNLQSSKNGHIQVKGIPPCLISSLHKNATNIHISSKTSNRWYVDADHQCDEALLFFPDLLQFHKDDQCRFCTLNTQCDGFFLSYLKQERTHLSAFLELDTV